MKYEAIIFDYSNTLAYKKDLEIPDENKHLVRKLYSQGYRLAIISNSDRYGDGMWLRTKLESESLLRYFEVVVSSAVIGISKPDPSIFKNVIQVLNIKAHKCLMVGDSMRCDVNGAKRVGLDALYVDLDAGIWIKDLRKMLGNTDKAVKLSHITEFELTSIKCKARHLSEELTAGDHVLIAGTEHEILDIEPNVTKDQMIHGSSSDIVKFVVRRIE